LFTIFTVIEYEYIICQPNIFVASRIFSRISEFTREFGSAGYQLDILLSQPNFKKKFG
jgi:hypothetical protein